MPPDTRVDELEGAVRTVCEPIFNKPLEEISFATVLMRLFEIARRFDMRVQPQLLLLQKTMLQIEGLGRQLYPQLDLWKTAQPILQDWAVGPLQRPQFRRAVPPPAAGHQRGGARAAAGAAAVHPEGGRRHAADPRWTRRRTRSCAARSARAARRRDQTIVGAAVLLAGIVWLALRVDWLPGAVLTAAGLLTVLLARR